MRNDKFLLFFGIACIVAAIIVYATSYFSCEEKESSQEVLVKCQATMYGLQSYHMESVSTTEVGLETSTVTSIKDYVAPNSYHGKNVSDDEWLEYVFVDGKQYYRASFGPEWREGGNFEDRQVFMQISDDFRMLGTLTNIEKKSDQKVQGVDCYHYQVIQNPQIDIEAEIERIETYLYENPEVTAGTDSMSIEEIIEQQRKNLERASKTETIIDLWIGKDDYLLRQIKNVTEAMRLLPDGSDQQITTNVIMTWSRFNELDKIAAPEVEWTPSEPVSTPSPSPTPSPTPASTL